ncbi:MAG: signal peptide peptidase SppA [Candidatus Sericytochromatia bacterium]
MNQEKLIAGGLVLFCAIAAVGSWFAGQPATKEDSGDAKSITAMMAGDAGIAQLDIEGMNLDSGSPGGLGSSGATYGRAILKAIDRIREDKVPVVLLNINSPGGTASASQAIFDELLRLKREQNTKIVATMGDLAASGGYYVACAADTIVANPSTLTGSIGVIMHNQNLQGLMGKVGVQNTVIKSGKHKDIMSPYRPISPEERAILQSLIDDTYDQFLDAVASGRKMSKTQVRPLADGRIYTGRQAHKVKLVDKLGNFSVAVDEARTLGKLGKDVDPKNYTEENWRDMFNQIFTSTMNPWSQALSMRHVMIQSGAFDKVPLMIYE